jgi:hypothetical protein
MKKELLISAKFDTSGFDKAIDQMQRKLKDITQMSMTGSQYQTAQRMQGAGMGGILSQPSMDAYKRSTQQARRELDQIIKEQAQGQEKITKVIVQREVILERLRQKQKDLVKGSEDELRVKEMISRVEENQFRKKEQYRQRDDTLNQLLDARQASKPQGIARLLQAYQGGGIGGAMTAGGRMLGGMGAGGMIAGLGGFLSSGGYLLNRGAEIYRDIATQGGRTDISTGNAVQGTMGRDVSNIYGRRTAFEMNFGQERARAAQMALQNLSANQLADKLGLAGNLGMIAGGGLLAAKGGSIGAGVGSALPIVGTAAGAAAGALPGVMAAGKGMMNLFGNERQRSLLMSPFSKEADKRYQSMLAEQLVDDYGNILEAQKKQNPFKTAAVQEYEQNFMRNLQAQRSMGLNNQGFYGPGGFMSKSIGAGFTPEMGLEMSGGILSAGGSTRAARESVFGLQLQRNADLTNAAQVMGTISGGVGGGESTKQATIKILAEGMKLGLDDSKFAEENRKFTQAAAEIISRSGAQGAEDFERISGGFGRFMAEPTTKGIEAAKTAYEQYQQISSAVTGPRGVMRAAGFMRDEKLKNLSTIEKQALMQIPEEQLNESNVLVKGAADQLGMSPQDLVKRISNINQGAVSRFREADSIRDRLRSRMKSLGIGQVTEDNIDQLPQDVRQDFYKLAAYQSTELGYKGSREAFSFASGTVGKVPPTSTPGAYGPPTPSPEELIQAKLAGGTETGRMEDTTVKAMAADSGTVLKNFNEMSGSMKKAAETAALFNDQIREMNAAMMQALDNSRNNKNAETLNTIQDILKKQQDFFKNQGPNQTQAGKQAK